MPSIIIGHEKGGVGKSTTAANIGVMLHYMEKDVCIIDATVLTDKDKPTTLNFIERRNAREFKHTPPCIRLTGQYLNHELVDLSKRYEYLVVEVGGSDNVEFRSAMIAQTCKKMYAPTGIGIYDLEKLPKLDDLVYLSKTYNEDLECYVFLNKIPKVFGSESAINDAKELIQSFKNLKLMNSMLYERMSILNSPNEALTVVEYEEARRKILPKNRIQDYLYKGSLEICELYKEMIGEEFKHIDFPTLLEYQEKNKEDSVNE